MTAPELMRMFVRWHRGESPLRETGGRLTCTICGWSSVSAFDGREECAHASEHFHRTANTTGLAMSCYPLYIGHPTNGRWYVRERMPGTRVWRAEEDGSFTLLSYEEALRNDLAPDPLVIATYERAGQ